MPPKKKITVKPSEESLRLQRLMSFENISRVVSEIPKAKRGRPPLLTVEIFEIIITGIRSYGASQAEMANLLSISPATLSSWKTRGSRYRVGISKDSERIYFEFLNAIKVSEPHFEMQCLGYISAARTVNYHAAVDLLKLKMKAKYGDAPSFVVLPRGFWDNPTKEQLEALAAGRNPMELVPTAK